MDHDQSGASADNSDNEQRASINRRDYLKYTGVTAGALTTGPSIVSADDGGAATSVSDPEPIDLRVEYTENPIGIDTSVPRLSWNVAISERGWRQDAYQILVSSTEEKLRNDIGDVWDSGKVSSSRSTNIEYQGVDLQSHKRYYWKVRVWGEDTGVSAWSDPAFWEMSFLGEDEWNAEWIGYENLVEQPQDTWSDYTFETDFVVKNRAAGLLFRAQDSNNLYMWQINTIRGPPPLLRPHVRENGQWRALEPVPIGDVLGDSPHETHRAKIVLRGDEITTYIDGQQVDSRKDSTHATGTIGFRQDGPEHARYDNVLVVNQGGETLFKEDFSGMDLDSFTGGTLTEGMLNVQDSGVILHKSGYSNPAPLLRNVTEIDKEVATARAHIAGLGTYQLFLNGTEVGPHKLDPGRTDYEETVLYSTYDVTDYLTTGENAIGVSLGRGRYGELLSNTFNWHDAPWWSDPDLLFQLNIEFTDGTTTSVASDENWSVTDGPTRFDSLYGGEVYDARKERSGWTAADYDDSEWNAVTEVTGPAGELISQRVQPVEVTETLDPVQITEPEPDVYVFDIGQMISGWVELSVSGPTGTEIKMSLGEKLYPDTGTVNNDNTHIPGDMQVDEYTLNGEGTETWESQFTYKGFRYVQIEGIPGTPDLDTIEAKVVHSSITENVESGFKSSNELLNQIHTNTRWAIRNNSHSVPEDTPAREKNAYGADAQVVAEATIYNFSMARFYTKWLRDWADSQRENGRLPTVAPNAGDWTYSQGGPVTPGWGSAYVLIPWWLYQYHGDRRVLEEHYDGMHRYVQRMDSIADDYILKTGLGDWNAPGGGVGENANTGFTNGEWNAPAGSSPPPEGPAITSTAYFYRDAVILAEVAEVLDKPEAAEAYRKMSEKIKTAFNNEFYDTTNEIYRTGEVEEYRQTSNVVPLAFGLVPEAREDAVVENLVNNVMEEREGHLGTGAIGTKYLLQVLTEYGHPEAAYAVAAQTTYPSWGWWIEEVGATALFERWDRSLSIFSRDHQYFGSVDEWFYQYVAGIREPAEPGFKHIEIAPAVVEDLEWAEAKTETVQGTVTSRWERFDAAGDSRDSAGLTLRGTIPGNATATFKIPVLGGDKVRVRENGKTIWNNGNRTRPNHPGVESVSRDGDEIAVDVASGEYDFELERIGK